MIEQEKFEPEPAPWWADPVFLYCIGSESMVSRLMWHLEQMHADTQREIHALKARVSELETKAKEQGQ